MNQGSAVDGGGQIVTQTLREVKGLLGRYVLDALQQLRIAVPADLDAAEQVGLRPRHLEHALRVESELTENLFVRLEPYLGAAPVRDLAELLQPGLRFSALEDLAIELAAAC